ncbi:MAG: C69 family dipeptidase, partial [Bacteroidales bacterium]|nr:C69 family dipeptidase [Bacteroidales bacterium]
SWSVDSTLCSWERTISTPNTTFSFVAQARGWLPATVGAKVWWGVDDTWYTCYVPLYVHNTSVPKPFATGDLNHYDPSCAWWAFNFVSNYSNLRYSDMMPDIAAVQQKWESKFMAEVDSLEKSVLKLSTEEQIAHLTAYSDKAANGVLVAWQQLGNLLVTKHNDGYIKDAKGHPQTAPYPENWYRNVLKTDPQQGYPIHSQQPENMKYQPF